MSYAIRVEGLGKRYDINRSSKAQTTSIRDQISNGIHRLLGRSAPSPLVAESDAVEHESLRATQEHAQQKEFWALKDVDFEVGHGERIGIIGANGAGKSTLLKILSRITAPTEGRVEIRGKVASLLEVGTGFHPELSGRENIYLNGAILGMSRSEIRAKFDQIVEFSGVEKFIDTPVKHYSSGMYVRLAFSVSAWLDPDILIVDEVLAVGDSAFQKKCAERIKDMTKEGRTVLFVSHSMATVNQTCHKALYLENGRVVTFAPVEEATIEYQRHAANDGGDGGWHQAEFITSDNKNQVIYNKLRPAELICARVLDSHDKNSDKIDIAELFFVEIEYSIEAEVQQGVVPNLHFYDELGGRVFISFPQSMFSGQKGHYIIRCKIPAFALNTGRYMITLALSTYVQEEPNHFEVTSCLRFEIVERDISLDVRRHGFTGVLPGYSRPRFDWEQMD